MLVTSAVVRTYIGFGVASSAAPSRRLSISTMWKPGFCSGMPTTSNSALPPGLGNAWLATPVLSLRKENSRA
jgi:hypothetical protein